MLRLSWVFGAFLGVSLILPAWSHAGMTMPPLVLEKTVGTSSTGCAAAGQIVVQKGTLVYYCYKATNNTPVTMELNALEDDILGNLTPHLPSILAPGQTFTLSGVPTGGFAINLNTVNVATLTGVFTPETDGTVMTEPLGTSAIAQGTAEVVIAAQAAPALGDAALAFVAAAMLLFGAIRLSRNRRDQA